MIVTSMIIMVRMMTVGKATSSGLIRMASSRTYSHESYL
jgi:hypothetical protein